MFSMANLIIKETNVSLNITDTMFIGVHFDQMLSIKRR